MFPATVEEAHNNYLLKSRDYIPLFLVVKGSGHGISPLEVVVLCCVNAAANLLRPQV